MLKILMVGVGGFAGAICRYLVYEATLILYKGAWFPLGTLTVNISGCFVIGILGGLSETREIFTPEIRALVFVGFLGGFTTFSTFAYENHIFLKGSDYLTMLPYIILTFTLGISAVFLGLYLAKIW